MSMSPTLQKVPVEARMQPNDAFGAAYEYACKEEHGGNGFTLLCRLANGNEIEFAPHPPIDGDPIVMGDDDDGYIFIQRDQIIAARVVW